MKTNKLQLQTSHEIDELLHLLWSKAKLPFADMTNDQLDLMIEAFDRHWFRIHDEN